MLGPRVRERATGPIGVLPWFREGEFQGAGQPEYIMHHALSHVVVWTTLGKESPLLFAQFQDGYGHTMSVPHCAYIAFSLIFLDCQRLFNAAGRYVHGEESRRVL